MTTPPAGIRVTTFTLSSPNPIALAEFYEKLLGWSIGTRETGWVTLPNPDGGLGIAFHMEDVYAPPVWPSEPGRQIMQGHLEIAVDDLDAASAHAVSSGATVADHQPQDDVRVHLDPDGHPFCLYLG